VEGAWVEAIASVVRSTKWAVIYCAPIATHHFAAYLDVGIGAGTPTPILNDFFMATNTTVDYNDCYFCIGLPLEFNLGDKISFRVKDTASFGVAYNTSIRIFE
jgi:hypothetical protein